jgi:phospholipase C
MARSTRIQHVVVLMLENRSFDHIFGYRQGVNGLKGTEFNLLTPSAPVSASNPPYLVSNGAPYAVPVGEGPGHSFADANVQLSGNKAGPGASSPATTQRIRPTSRSTRRRKRSSAACTS